MDRLVVPLELAGADVKRHEAVRPEVLAGRTPGVREWVSGPEIDHVELRIDGRDRPRRSSRLCSLGGIAPREDVRKLRGIRRRERAPNQRTRLRVVRIHMTAKRALATVHAGEDEPVLAVVVEDRER